MKEWCPGYFTEDSWLNVSVNGYGSCAACGKWCKATKTSAPFKHKREVVK